MKVTGLTFNRQMVLALLSDIKGQTRRVMRVQPTLPSHIQSVEVQKLDNMAIQSLGMGV